MKSGTGHSGKASSGLAYLRQRIRDVLQTELGSLVLNRNFGSNLHLLIDRNVDADYEMDAYIYLFEAFDNPANGLDDCKLITASITSNSDRSITHNLEIELLENGESITIDNLVIEQ